MYILLIGSLFVLLFLIILFIGQFAKKEKLKSKQMQQEKQLEEERHKQQALQAFKTATKIPIQSEFVAKGSELKLLVAKHKYDNIVACMNKLSLPNGHRLLVQQPNCQGIGGVSHLVIELPERKVEEKIWSHISVEKSALGAMQVFFLDRLWHYLPLWWHAKYDRRYYVYTKEDLQSICKEVFSEESVAATSSFGRRKRVDVFELVKLDVSSSMAEKEGKFYVSCCFWSNFKGLVREFVEIDLENCGVFDIKQETLYKYHCGILY